MHSERTSSAIAQVGLAERAKRHGHPGAVVWLTGLSGSGKSTLCRALERELFDSGYQAFALEGDELRQGINSNLGFTAAERHENVRRAAEIAKLFCQAGIVCIMALISPSRETRRYVRKLIGDAGGLYVQVWVNASLEVCEGRDVKGLYERARRGEIPEFTGISAPYEVPVQSEVVVRTDRHTVAESVGVVMDYLRPLLRGEKVATP